MPRKPALLLQLFNLVLRPIAGQTPAASNQLVALPQHPPAHDHEAWRAYWKVQGQSWRIEPEIDVERQEYLARRHTILPDIQQSIYPFKAIKLSRADVEWLLATHENGRGPVDWNDESQRERDGLDLRGADLSNEDLQELPLARLVGGFRTWAEWAKATEEQRMLSAVLLKGANLNGAHLEGAFLFSAHMESVKLYHAHLAEAVLFAAHLERAMLFEAHLEDAELNEIYLENALLNNAHLENTNLHKAHLRGADLCETHLENAYLSEADLQDTNLTGAYLKGALLLEACLENAWLNNAHLEGTDCSMAHLERADLSNARLKGASLVAAHLERADLSEACLVYTDLREVHFEDTQLKGAILCNEKLIGPRLADVQWINTNLGVVKWSQVSVLGDEYVARQKKRNRIAKDKEIRLEEHEEAVRANRQLAVVLQEQGLNKEAARFTYRAHALQRRVFWFQMIRPRVKLRQRIQALEAWIFSWFLFLLAGYGYRLGRSFLAYLSVISLFMILYHVLDPHLAWSAALVVSMTAFHGRGFSPSTFTPGDPLSLASAAEAFVGLIIEVTFIATLTQRFFRR